jgi:hypothetical protein
MTAGCEGEKKQKNRTQRRKGTDHAGLVVWPSWLCGQVGGDEVFGFFCLPFRRFRSRQPRSELSGFSTL